MSKTYTHNQLEASHYHTQITTEKFSYDSLKEAGEN